MGRKFRLLMVAPRQSIVGDKGYSYEAMCDPNYFPIGMGYITSILKSAGYQVDCMNLNYRNGSTRDLISKALDDGNYDFVCTGDNAKGFAITERIIQTVRNHGSKARVILGGPIVTSEPETMFDLLIPLKNPKIGLLPVSAGPSILLKSEGFSAESFVGS